MKRDVTSSSTVSTSMDCWARNSASAPCACAAPNRQGHAISRPQSLAKWDLRRLIAIEAACGPRFSRMELFRSATSFKRINGAGLLLALGGHANPVPWCPLLRLKRMNLKVACWLVFLLGGLETRRLSFAFGGQRSFFEPNMHRSFR